MQILFILIGIGLLILVILTLILMVVMSGSKSNGAIPRPQPAELTENLAINIRELSPKPIQGASVAIQLHGLPLRLAILVIAPVGKGTKLPTDPSSLRQMIEQIAPGISEVLDTHQPIFRRWPTMLSVRGFYHALFANLKLPGDNGKNTQWCGIAGPIETEQGRVMVGLILHADAVNSYGQIEIEHAGQWLSTIRTVKL